MKNIVIQKINIFSNHYEMMGMGISHMIVYNWMGKYSEMVEKRQSEIISRIIDPTLYFIIL